MMLKFIFCAIISFMCFFLGKIASEEYKSRLAYISASIYKIERLINEVEYSSTNISTKNILEAGNNEVEIYCNGLIKNMIDDSKKCNSVLDAVSVMQNTKSVLSEYKSKKQEEYGNKIASMPKLGLLAGVFVSIMII